MSPTHQQRTQSASSSNSQPVILLPNPLSYVPKSTPEEYIRAIVHHSRQTSADTLYPGEIYDTLQRFLEQKSNTTPSSVNHTLSDYAWLISPSLGSQQIPPDRQPVSDGHSVSDSGTARGRYEGFTDTTSCIDALRRNIELSQPQVLFLRGHPSPQWLSDIGAFCHADPELFRWFLRYRAESGSDYYFDSAPSVLSNICRFKVFTVGCKNHRHGSSQTEIDLLRKMASNDLQDYQTRLRGKWDLKTGDSIVRGFYVLDERHCVIEQEIAISIFDVGKTWMAIACTDAGYDLSQGPKLPWIGKEAEAWPTSLLPIIQYRPRCALKSRSIYEGTTVSKRGKLTQSFAVFPEGYGRNIIWSRARTDRYHVMSEFFMLAAFSQKQLLNVLREKIMTESNRLSLSNEMQTLSNLLYFRDLLWDQLRNSLYMLQLVEDQNRASQNGYRPVRSAASNLKNVGEYAATEEYRFFQDLHSQAQSLHETCTQGMKLISNKSMLAESQRAMEQAKLVTKLTLVAFVYLPFTFTAGFFGMNLKELETGSINLWVYFAVSLPLMLVTLGVFVLDVPKLRRLLKTLHIAHREKKIDENS